MVRAMRKLIESFGRPPSTLRILPFILILLFSLFFGSITNEQGAGINYEKAKAKIQKEIQSG